MSEWCIKKHGYTEVHDVHKSNNKSAGYEEDVNRTEG